MVTTVLMDVGRSTDRHSGWHCLQCGEVIDAGIATNRKGHLEPKRNGARPPGSPAKAGGARRRSMNI
jgi:hypothetical protein